MARRAPQRPSQARKTAKQYHGATSVPEPVKRAARAKSRPLPITWADATVSMTTGGGWAFTLPEVESANRLSRNGRGRTYKSDRAKDDTAQALHRWRHVVPLAGPVVVTITWHRARKVGDLDNRCKGTLDLLKKIAFADDAQVEQIHMARHDDPAERPRIEVTVAPVAA